MTESSQRPFSIRVFVPNGDPDGLRLVEKSNWTGIGVVFNRTNFKEAIKRPEIERTGIYVLVGDSEDGSLPTVYVGEGDPVKERLTIHYSKKDFWDRAIFFVTKDSSLNKAHVQRLECRLLEFAREAKQCRLDNNTCPTPPSLSEADTADVDCFLLDMLSIFPLLNLSVFERVTPTAGSHETLSIDAKGLKATGYEDAKGFVVCQGSQFVKEEANAVPAHIAAMRKDLIETGLLFDAGNFFRLTQNHVFTSPSTAASAILGNSSNGRILWKASNGKTLKELQTQAANAASQGDSP